MKAKTSKARLGVEELGDRLTPANITWTGSISGNFGTGANWSGGVVPGTTDVAVIDSNATINLAEFRILGGIRVPGTCYPTITFGDNVVVKNLDVAAGCYNVAAGKAVTFYEATVTSSESQDHATYFDALDGTTAGSFRFGGVPPGKTWGAVTFGGLADTTNVNFEGPITLRTSSYTFDNVSFDGHSDSDSVVFALSEGNEAPSPESYFRNSVAFAGLNSPVQVGGTGASTCQFWVTPGSNLSVGGTNSGLVLGNGIAFIQDTESTVTIPAYMTTGGDSLKVTGGGTDYNMLGGTTLAASGYVEFTGTGTVGDAGLLVKGDASIDADGVYLDNTKIEFQGSGLWHLDVTGGMYVTGRTMFVFRGNYDTPGNDKIVTDSFYIGNASGNNSVSMTMTGTAAAMSFKLIDTANSYTKTHGDPGGWDAYAKYGTAPAWLDAVATGQLGAQYVKDGGGDFYFETLQKS